MTSATPKRPERPPEAATHRLATLPNALSLLRLATVPVFLWLFVTGRENAAVALYGVAAWTDFLDGFIARRTGSVSELGKLLDPISDRVFIVALSVMLLVRRAMPWWLGAAIIVRDVLILSLFPALERRGVERISVSFIGKLATALILLGLTVLAWSLTDFPLAGQGTGRAGLLITVAGGVCYWAAGIMYAREALTRLRSLKIERTVV